MSVKLGTKAIIINYTTRNNDTVASICRDKYITAYSLIESNKNVSCNINEIYTSTLVTTVSESDVNINLDRNLYTSTLPSAIEVYIESLEAKSNKDYIKVNDHTVKIINPDNRVLSVRIKETYILSFKTLDKYLQYANSRNLKLRSGLTLIISTIQGTSTVTTNGKISGLIRNNTMKISKIGTCSYVKFLNGVMQGSSYTPLPVIPVEFSETNGAKFNPVPLLGRSVDYQIYQGSSREITFTLNLHAELLKDYGNLDLLTIIADLNSCCYPGYDSGNHTVKPPEIAFKIGKFSIRGIISSISNTWKLPIINNEYQNCDLSITITETTGPYSMSQIKSFKGDRVR